MMNFKSVQVSVPATSANLGPGFDCLALALDLWNEALFEPAESGFTVENEGEGADELPTDLSNLILQSAFEIFNSVESRPPGLRIRCCNRIPMGSGLGSSAAAIVMGLVGANEFMGRPFSREQLLKMASDKEGHPDNAAAALYGGLVVVLDDPGGVICRRFDLPEMGVVVAVPTLDLPTHTARKALPARVDFKDAVFNSSRTPLVVEALRTGDLDLLGKVMHDRLHQPYRLPLIPGAQEAIEDALRAGAKAAALSGAGPGIIAFLEAGSGRKDEVQQCMLKAFMNADIVARGFVLKVTDCGAKS
jgi:homoserine kinase